ncbi:MAG TPA: hypothetical protein DCM05_04345 [Elusimicrobia bacterium]|nr:hypothetical protein [Elusimicrobiota bacterium]
MIPILALLCTAAWGQVKTLPSPVLPTVSVPIVPVMPALSPAYSPALSLLPSLASVAPLPSVSAPVLAGLSAWQTQAASPRPADPKALWDGAVKKAAPALTPVLALPAAPWAPRLAAPAPGHRGVGAETVPGSVFDWRPVEKSPGHGFPLLDRLIRWFLSRKSSSFKDGFELPGSRREDAGVFLYGERHTDKALIAENMRRLAENVQPGKGALVLDEAYFGPRLFGREALDYLEAKGLDPDSLPDAVSIEVSGWDDREIYDRTLHPSLQHHMNLLDINHHLYSPERGWGYYAALARKARETFKNWLGLRREAIGGRNRVLDDSLRTALKEADREGKSLHLIAGAEHLLEKPYWLDAPLFGTRIRKGLLRALEGRPYWGGKPADSVLE